MGATGAKDNAPTCDGNHRRWHRTTGREIAGQSRAAGVWQRVLTKAPSRLFTINLSEAWKKFTNSCAAA